MVDKQSLVEKLVGAGFENSIAVEKVDAVYDAVKDLVNTDDEAQIMSIVSVKIGELARTSKDIEKFNGLVLAVGDRVDAEQYNKFLAESAYKDNPAEAIRLGKVKVNDDNTITPLDTKKFLDKAEKMANNNYGKPIKTRMQREIVTVIQDKGIFRLFGDHNADVGSKVTVFGVEKNGFINLKGPGIMKQAQLDELEFYDMMMEEIPTSNLAADITLIGEKKGPQKGNFVILNAKVRYVNEISSGFMVVLGDTGDEMDDGIVGFCNGESALNQAATLEEGNEVIAFGKVGMRVVDGEKQYNLSLIGIVKNPSSEGYGDIMAQLDDVLY